MENPKKMVAKFCDAVNINYIESALSWEPGADTGDYSWWDGGSFHKNLRQSTGLQRQERRYVDLNATPPRVQQVYRRMKPHYERLYQHRSIP